MDGDFRLPEILEAARSAAPAVAHEPATSPAVPYPPTAALPTQAAARGIRYDFNSGARVLLPARGDGGLWRLRMRDLDTGNILFETTTPGATVNSSKRYFVRFGLEIWDGDIQVLDHAFSAEERDVLIQFPVGTLGDILAWFPYAARFAEQHRCRLTCAMSGLIIPLLRDAYPLVHFVTHEEAVEQDLAATFYATYSLGLFFHDVDHVWQPCDFRLVGLHRTAAYILGVDPADEAPRLALTDESRPLEAPYVCIAVQSSSQPKYWNNPYGWHDVVQFLKKAGYRVICIDQKATHGAGLVWNHIPHGAENHTGDYPLVERARWLRHAAFFIGTSSGLSWLAWAAGTPVVLISGFTQASNEFATPYRVINYHACNSCWNDVRHSFAHHDFLWCPRHAGTDRQFECTKLITAEQVKNVIRRIPAFVGMTEMPECAASAELD